jgi:hypothetical protein
MSKLWARGRPPVGHGHLQIVADGKTFMSNHEVLHHQISIVIPSVCAHLGHLKKEKIILPNHRKDFS